MTDRTDADRRRTQRFTVEKVLIPHINKILDRDLIFVLSQEMDNEMANSPTSWAFKDASND